MKEEKMDWCNVVNVTSSPAPSPDRRRGKLKMFFQRGLHPCGRPGFSYSWGWRYKDDAL